MSTETKPSWITSCLLFKGTQLYIFKKSFQDAVNNFVKRLLSVRFLSVHQMLCRSCFASELIALF